LGKISWLIFALKDMCFAFFRPFLAFVTFMSLPASILRFLGLRIALQARFLPEQAFPARTETTTIMHNIGKSKIKTIALEKAMILSIIPPFLFCTANSKS
jgi:hypothetical protein